MELLVKQGVHHGMMIIFKVVLLTIVNLKLDMVVLLLNITKATGLVVEAVVVLVE